jgi:DUF3014 family protein
MPDQLDFDLHRTGAPGDPVESVEPVDTLPPKRPIGPLIVIGVLTFAVGLAIYIVFGRSTSAPVDSAPAAPAAIQATEEPIRPLGGAADSIAVPPLDDSDPLVRELVGKLSSHPRVAAWLATRGLIRNFTAVVANVAEGVTPATHLQPIRPAETFRVAEQDDTLLIDSRSYARYDRLADAFVSLDVAGSARLYSTLKPRIDEAYRDLGFPEGSFDRTLERAIVSLLAVPVPAGPIEVQPKGIVYGYADPELEALTPAQKHLLRMGSRNARLVQRKLREVALELGIPSGRLPAAK